MPAASELDAPPAEQGARPGRPWRAWVRVLAGALLVALALRVFVVEAYRIPSVSMEETLRPGDFLFVSKLHYGPRLPLTLGLPFSDWYYPGLEMPARRLPGFSAVRRGDVVVFNYPPEEGPVDRRETYIKRVIGLPGDTVEVRTKVVSVNGERVPDPPLRRQLWRVEIENGAAMPPPETLAAWGVGPRFDRVGGPVRLTEGTDAEIGRLRRWPGVRAVIPLVRTPDEGRAPFPPGRPWTLDDFGPLVVPGRGVTVRLDDMTWLTYRDVLTRFEGVRAERTVGGFVLDGTPADRYTFAQDYYFVMGDNRDDSADSRSWGFVPESHLVGKAVLVYFSWDDRSARPRWDRVLRRIE
ncbi:MAG TPA: signal peptidase I [Rubricoccaceae bacterium]|nr:signal peptidase I [Rubricoccaceae bacterium]